MRISFWILLSHSVLVALPKGSELMHGDAKIQSDGSHMQIHAGDRSILHWQEFSITPSERVQFIQPSSKSSVLNRVQGDLPSHIMGELLASGKIYLINPNGVIFGKDAVISVGSLVASTLDCSDGSFLLHEDLLFQGISKETIIHYGTIQAIDGDITLLGRVVENHGLLSAPQGEVHLMAGQEILIRPTECPLLTIRPNQESSVTHTGFIEALRTSLQAEGQAYAYGINIEGSVLALQTVEEGGKIFLKSEGVSIRPSGSLSAPQGHIEMITGEKGLYTEGSVVATGGTIQIQQDPVGIPSFQMGTLDVSGDQGGSVSVQAAKWISHGKIFARGTEGKGGLIAIDVEGPYIETVQGDLSTHGTTSGGSIAIHSNASIFSSGHLASQGEVGGEISLSAPVMNLVSADLDASGKFGGGSIHIGADSDVKTIYLGGDTHLSVSAKEKGHGGDITIIAEEQTVCYGSIEAKGGVLGGNGGAIEVSGKEGLGIYASCDAGAPFGSRGELLLDPKDIVIDATTGVYPQYTLIDPSALGTGTNITVTALSTGNVVVTKPNDGTGASTAGAVYLYNGLTAALISTIVGSTGADQTGSGGVTALTGNGNFVFRSPNWDNGAATNAGAVTWGSGTTGVTGFVSASNSLVGTQSSDAVGAGVLAFTNGNYVVRSPNWNSNRGAVTWGGGTTGITGAVSSSNSLVGTTGGDGVGTSVVALSNGHYVVRSPSWSSSVGAATWGDGTTGTVGAVSASNSLVGTTAGDNVGGDGIVALTNGNYVVASRLWDNSGFTDAGAVTFGNGTTGTTGAVSSSNSLVGTASNDRVGIGGVTALTNGNYVVRSQNWNSSAGAVTWGDGTIGVSGDVSVSNSLIGTTGGDTVGGEGVTALTNGNYVVTSRLWNNGGVAGAGAVTWGNGATGIVGTVSSSNSLVGTQVDSVGGNTGGAIALTNGNYVVSSPSWKNGGSTANGAVTWGNGTTGITGAVTSSNSLVGTAFNDLVGLDGVFALTNGNYVVCSSLWFSGGGGSDGGAVTWGDGTTGITGPVSTSNSLYGTSANDNVGNAGVTVLTNGNYVVRSSLWNSSRGAVTWGDGTTGVTGPVSASNSLVGTKASDPIGSSGVTALTNGNYVVRSGNWDDGAQNNVGAVTWGNGTVGLTGTISTSNSLYGTTPSDNVGGSGVTALANGNYIVLSANWDNGGTTNAGAATWGNGTTGTIGAVSTQNSIVGTISSSSLQTSAVDDTVNGTFIVRFNGGSGLVRVGFQDPNQMSFARAQAQTITIQPSFITTTLNAGTNVTLQANNDVTLSSALTSSGAGSLTIQAGRSVAINGNVTLANADFSVTANDLLAAGIVDAYRDAGNATLSIGNNVTIDTGTGNLTLALFDGAGKTNTGSGDLTIGDSATLQCSGSGIMSLFAQEHNVTIGSNALLQTANGNLLMIAGEDISGANPFTVRATGSGQVTLVTDNLFPTSPLYGTGSALFPNATLTTGGGKLLIYTSERSLNQVPATINGVAYVPGPLAVNSTTEKWGVYYPSSSGIPFTIFYKNPTAIPGPSPSPSPSPSAAVVTAASYATMISVVSSFQDWMNFWNKDAVLGVDPFAPYLIQKGFFIIPFLPLELEP